MLSREPLRAGPSSGDPGPPGRRAATVDPRSVIVQAEQRDHAGDVCFVASANEIADPSRFRIHVMRFGATCRDELLADEQWKRQIRQPVAVQMSQLAPSEPKLNPAKSVRSGRHARPRRYLTRDRLLDALGHVCILPGSPTFGLL